MSQQHSEQPSIEFIGCSNNLTRILFSAIKQVSSTQSSKEIWEHIQSGDIEDRLIQKEIERLNLSRKSQLSTSHFVFVIKNISFSSISYLEKKKAGLESTIIASDLLLSADKHLSYCIPDDVLENDELNIKWQKLHRAMINLYKDCLMNGVEEKDAKLALSSGCTSRRQLSFSFCELAEFLSSSMCHNAVEEIKSISWQIYDFMKEEFPTLAKRLGIKCWENKELFCNENRLVYQNCPYSKERPHQDSFSRVFHQSVEPQPIVNTPFSVS